MQALVVVFSANLVRVCKLPQLLLTPSHLVYRVRDQGVGGSNPLPTNIPFNNFQQEAILDSCWGTQRGHDLGLVDVMANDYFHLDLASDARKINIYGPPTSKGMLM